MDQEAKRIIAEVGEEFGLSKDQSLDLFDQYWNEYVLRNLLEMKVVNLNIIGFGSYHLKKTRTDKYRKALVENKNQGKYTEERIEKIDGLFKILEERNAKFKRKRIYG